MGEFIETSSPTSDGAGLQNAIDNVLSHELSLARDELRTADGKAFRWVAGVGSVVATGATMAGNGIAAVTMAFVATSLVFAAAAVILFATALFPRCPKERGPIPATYFGHFAAHDEPWALLDNLIGEPDMRSRAARQLIALSKIAERKYRWIKRGVPVALAATLFATGGMIAHLLTSV